MPGKALEDWLEEAGGSPAVRSTILALARAAVNVSGELQSGALSLAPSDLRAEHPAVDDERKTLERYGNECFLEEVRGAPVALFASGELQHPELLDPTAPLAVAMDSLDGSANIDTNMPVGTVFAILPVEGDVGGDPLTSLLQPGANQVAAGFFCYGPRLALAITLGQGTHVFIYGPRVGAFLRSHVQVQIPPKTDEFAVDISMQRHWDRAIRHYVDDCIHGSEGPHGRDFTMRWTASLVADAYRAVVSSSTRATAAGAMVTTGRGWSIKPIRSRSLSSRQPALRPTASTRSSRRCPAHCTRPRHWCLAPAPR